jgi:3-hydroxyacyl-CoA dehydrogenase
MRLGLGRSTGPFETMDITDLNVTLGAMLAIYEETGDLRFWPPDLVRRKVAAGHPGRQTERGRSVYNRGKRISRPCQMILKDYVLMNGSPFVFGQLRMSSDGPSMVVCSV